MKEIFAALYAITMVFLGIPWVFSIIVTLYTGLEALEQPFIQLFLLAFPVVFMALIYLQKYLQRKKES